MSHDTPEPPAAQAQPTPAQATERPDSPPTEAQPTCTLAGLGRGDCAHFVGLHGQPTDAFGKPEGWCWWCWHSHQITVIRSARDDAEGRYDAAYAELTRVQAERHTLQAALTRVEQGDARLRAAEARVWPDGLTFGCDAAEHLAEAVLEARQRTEQAEAKVVERDALLREILDAADDEFWDRTYEARHKARALLGLDA